MKKGSIILILDILFVIVGLFLLLFNWPPVKHFFKSIFRK